VNVNVVDKAMAIVLHPIGRIRRQENRATLEILPRFSSALEGITGFSHIWVLYWFHENDTPSERETLKVHPRRDPTNPLTGVFATRSPVRPNLIGFAACRIIGVGANTIDVEDLDARDGSPILDVKPYIPKGDSIPEARTPEWLARAWPSKTEE
jgi:tRNA-Thr(GGU) m(6)t(6)A37 methyltransferase TsaA